MQAYTCYGSVRPFGVSSLVAGVDKTGPRLFCIEPSGVYYGYRACAIGKGRGLAKTELEKLVAGEADGSAAITCEQAVKDIARMCVARAAARRSLLRRLPAGRPRSSTDPLPASISSTTTTRTRTLSSR